MEGEFCGTFCASDLKMQKHVGLLIQIFDMKEAIAISNRPNSDINIDVLVNIEGEEKQFTWEDFLNRLGFKVQV